MATAPLSQFGVNVGGNLSNTGGNTNVTLQQVDPNQTVAGQLGTLLTSGNPLVQNSIQNANSMALARGGGLGGSLTTDAATRAAYASMTPIAQADAARYGSVADANQGALNQQNIQAMGDQAQVAAAGAGANGQVAAARINAAAHSADLATQLAQQQNQFEQGHQFDVENQQRQQGYYVNNATLNATLGTVFSDPAYWTNPNAALNMAHTFQNGFDQIFDGSNQSFANP